MIRVRGYVAWLLLAGIAAGVPTAWPGKAACDDAAVVRGTVAVVRPGSLYLREAREGAEEGAGRDVMVAVDGETKYYIGTKRAAADDVVPGIRILVRCAREGKTLRATTVRIVGGSPR